MRRRSEPDLHSNGACILHSPHKATHTHTCVPLNSTTPTHAHFPLSLSLHPKTSLQTTTTLTRFSYQHHNTNNSPAAHNHRKALPRAPVKTPPRDKITTPLSLSLSYPLHSQSTTPQNFTPISTPQCSKQSTETHRDTYTKLRSTKSAHKAKKAFSKGLTKSEMRRQSESNVRREESKRRKMRSERSDGKFKRTDKRGFRLLGQRRSSR